MTRSTRAWGLLALAVLVAGCGGPQAGSSASAASDRMVMPSGAAAVAAAPPDSALMVCGQEIVSKVQQVLAMPSPPATKATWMDGVYTCSYSLPMGPMTLSVHVLGSNAQAGTELDADRARTPGAQTLLGLGERAWGTSAGSAVVLKDNQILTVDTTGLPAVFGSNDQKRDDLAYEIASDVLGCWTGDES